MNKKHLKSFTLAEVLITLTIIGVIAAITIPNLLKNYQNHANYVALKKGYTMLSNAYRLAEKEYGTADNWNLQGTANSEEIADYFLQNMKYTKKCVQEIGCWIGYNKFKNIGGTAYQIESDGTNYTTAVLHDGSIVSFQQATRGAFVPWGSFESGVDSSLVALSNDRALTIAYDVNGKKGPNQIGRDIFGFVVGKNGIIPDGISTTEKCSPSVTDYGAYGLSCTYKVLQEGGIYY